jgi:hypothetical protein
MVEVFLLTCLQANFMISRIKVHPSLSSEQRAELIREIRVVTRKECPIY